MAMSELKRTLDCNVDDVRPIPLVERNERLEAQRKRLPGISIEAGTNLNKNLRNLQY